MFLFDCEITLETVPENNQYLSMTVKKIFFLKETTGPCDCVLIYARQASSDNE